MGGFNRGKDAHAVDPLIRDIFVPSIGRGIQHREKVRDSAPEIRRELFPVSRVKSPSAMRYLPYFCLLSGILQLATATPSVSGIIERGRATIGPEAALDNLVTLKLEGRVEPARPGQPEGILRIILRRPNSYRSTVRIEGLAEHTIVRGNEGCMIRSNPDLGESRMRALTGEEVNRIAVTTGNWFDPFSPGPGGDVRYVGIEDRRGRRCHRLAYRYPGDIVVNRFFTVNDGSLVSTVNDLGVESVEIGRQMIGGIIFPEKVEYYENHEKLHTLIFTRIEVNRPLPSGVFAIPK